jgi:hypothetical protein
MKILPTFTCFDDATEYIERRVTALPALVYSLELVHGLAVGDAGEVYAHAWVEEGAACWDAGLVEGQKVWYAVARDEFYAARRIRESTRYSCAQLLFLNRRFGHCGPWEARYRAACGRGDRQVVGSVQADASGARVRTFDALAEDES